MKSGGFHPEIRQISPRYHLWNPPKIIKASVSAKTLQFDECRVGDFTLKSGGFYLWNPAEFNPRFHLWNPPKIIKSKCFSKNSSVWMNAGWGLWPRISWNPHEIHRISCEIERPLARNCNPMFPIVSVSFMCFLLDLGFDEALVCTEFTSKMKLGGWLLWIAILHLAQSVNVREKSKFLWYGFELPQVSFRLIETKTSPDSLSSSLLKL